MEHSALRRLGPKYILHDRHRNPRPPGQPQGWTACANKFVLACSQRKYFANTKFLDSDQKSSGVRPVWYCGRTSLSEWKWWSVQRDEYVYGTCPRNSLSANRRDRVEALQRADQSYSGMQTAY